MTTKHTALPPAPRSTIWELTYDASHIDLPDTALASPLYEVGIDDTFTPTTLDVFTAWTGPRRVNGSLHHGPVYHLGTTIPYTGRRSCPCSTCQSTTDPLDRTN